MQARDPPCKVLQRPLLADVLGLFADDERQLRLVICPILVFDRPGEDDRIGVWIG